MWAEVCLWVLMAMCVWCALYSKSITQYNQNKVQYYRKKMYAMFSDHLKSQSGSTLWYLCDKQTQNLFWSLETDLKWTWVLALFLQPFCFWVSASVQLELLSVFLYRGGRWESSCLYLSEDLWISLGSLTFCKLGTFFWLY